LFPENENLQILTRARAHTQTNGPFMGVASTSLGYPQNLKHGNVRSDQSANIFHPRKFLYGIHSQ